jgi:protein phosphatase
MESTVLILAAGLLLAAGSLLVLGTVAVFLVKTQAKSRARGGATAPRVPSPTAPPAPSRRGSKLPGGAVAGDEDLTFISLQPPELREGGAAAGASGPAGQAHHEGEPVPIVYDAEAGTDQPTLAHDVILLSAVGQTDVGRRRRGNEDSYLSLPAHHLYAVADGMGGHAGGEVASRIAVDTLEAAFLAQRFEGAPHARIPRRGSELAQAIQMANRAIWDRAEAEPQLQGMGTTLVSARFTPGKERVYIGHVGDSRCYRYRNGVLTQLTSDHTMGALGLGGRFADHLSRALGAAPAVTVDLVIAVPRHDDVFVLCSDGLSKMVPDEEIRAILTEHQEPNEVVRRLVERANERGGKDNITVIVVTVQDPAGFVRMMDEAHARGN